MKKYLLKIWKAVNSPIADIIGGYIMIIVGILVCYYFSELTVPCVVAFASGWMCFMGLSFIDDAIGRFVCRKSSGKSDDNKKF